MAYKLVIFDFDGTLADTFPWFIRTVKTGAERYGFKPIEGCVIERLRHYNAREIIKYLGVPPWKLPLIARHMRILAAQDIDAIHLFDGVDDMLRQLFDAGVMIAIVSSNSEDNVRRTLGSQNARLIKHFACGASIFGKSAKFRKILRVSGVPRAEVICIGDEIRDLESARYEGISFGAVTWGFTRAEALAARSPKEIFSTPNEIVQKITSRRWPTEPNTLMFPGI
ncbi:HAD hydrolase-like protein [Microvirga sp. 2TAF3]|uniref:HAD hydrolase-like protein n=1 Tax=Microvirga sp. 2TAF3 TaxID=3233014 RepID=UPI003F9CC785